MATLQKFKLLATQCAVAGSPTRSPTTSPVIHLRRRKTLRMLLNRTSDRRFSRRAGSPDLQEIAEESSEIESSGSIKKEKIRVRRKLKELFISSPPFEDRNKSTVNDREGLLPATGGGVGGTAPAGFSSRRFGSSGSLRPVSSTFRYRLLRRAWRPVLVTIPE